MIARLEKISEDKLSRTIWQFCLNSDVCNHTKFTLDEYREQSRETIRKRTWRSNVSYNRIGDMRWCPSGVRIEAKDVPLTPEIVAEAKAQLIEQIQAMPVARDL